MTRYRIDVASPPHREELVAQITFGDTQWAELSHEGGTLQMEFYPRPDGGPWRIGDQEVVAVLEQAKEEVAWAVRLEGSLAKRLTGTCFCRAVRYAVVDEFRYAMICHCADCRRTTGSAFKPFAGIERGKFAVTEGGDKLMVYGDDKANDTHCRGCGSLLFSVVRDGAFVHVAMGTLLDDPSIRPSRHIFVGSKAPWFTITDDLPQYQEHAA